MSKYYKAEDVEIAIADTLQFESEVGRPYKVFLDSAKDMLKNLRPIEVSEDCISREYLKSFAYINKGDFNSVETIREWIDNAPNVVPGRAEGEWVEYRGLWKCSFCSETENRATRYCPNCGAKMKGADDETD